MNSNMQISALRAEIALYEADLYGPQSAEMSADERFELSMRLSIARAELAALLGIDNPTIERALDTPEED